MHRRVMQLIESTCIIVYYVTKHCSFWRLPNQKINQSLEKWSWCFPFTLWHHECDSRQPVYYGRALLPFLCSHMCLLRVVGLGGVARCGYCETTLPLDSACSAECQQLQLCSIAAHNISMYSTLKVHAQCAQLGVFFKTLVFMCIVLCCTSLSCMSSTCNGIEWYELLRVLHHSHTLCRAVARAHTSETNVANAIKSKLL